MMSMHRLPPVCLPRRRWLLAALAIGLMPTGWAQAERAPLLVEGEAFERQLRVAGVQLQLNGTGVRAVAWFKGYAAGLYLLEPVRSAAPALAAPGPKRLQIRMLHDVPAAEFEKAFTKGMQRNTPDEQHARLAQRIAAFAQAIRAVGQVRKGDVIDLDLDPARGTLFALNGTLRGPAIAGDDFYVALLGSFIGEHPYDARLKSGLLGQ
jgi:hypothetical protein